MGEFVFVFESEASGNVIDRTAGVEDFEAGPFGFGDFEEEIFGVVFFNGAGEVFVILVEFGGLIDEMEDAERVVFEEIDDGFVVLEADVMGELPESFAHEFVLFFLEDVGDVELL